MVCIEAQKESDNDTTAAHPAHCSATGRMA